VREARAFRRLARRADLLTGGLAVVLVVITVAGVDADFAPAVIVAIALCYACGAYTPTIRGLAATIALTLALQVLAGFADAPNAEIAIATLPPWWGGLQVRRRRQLVDELAERTRELEAEEESFVRLSVERERARIARDLHDIVSHHLAVVVIQAGAGRLAEPWQPDGAAERFATIRDAGVEALVEADRLVTMLHADADTARLGPLLTRARTMGAEVAMTPSDLALAPELETVACRVLQEALTNAMKHAPGAALEVALAERDGTLTIVVRNDSIAEGSGLAATGSGIGLASMRERLEALGGAVEAGPDASGGFVMRA
jgi:signal transduction histidine kinase